MPWQVYALIDPRDDAIRYVGATKFDPFIRMAQHAFEAARAKATDRSARLDWFASLAENGQMPTIRILEEIADDGDWRAAEKRWIRRFTSEGEALLNATSQSGVRRAATGRRRRRSLHLSDHQYDGLQRTASQFDITVSELLRRIIDQWAEQRRE